jgi:AcrR family transcriptional regulator
VRLLHVSTWRMPQPAKKSQRRSPIARDVGEKRLIDATIDLVRVKPFSEVGVREIAKRADINHGFVHVWFGSKHLLFMAARNQLLQGLIDKYPENLGGADLIAVSDPDAQLLVRLSIWLEIEGVDGIEMPVSAPLASAVAKNLETTYKMAPETALLSARIAIVLGVGHLAMERTFNWGEASRRDVADHWNEILKLLAAAHPA